jgi:hypothetical protein
VRQAGLIESSDAQSKLLVIISNHVTQAQAGNQRVVSYRVSSRLRERHLISAKRREEKGKRAQHT